MSSPVPALPPAQPDPLTPAQRRAMNVRVATTIQQGQRALQLPRPAPPPLSPGRAPAKRLFALHEVRRLPVTQTDAVRAFLISSSSEGRIFPQALAEAFALVPGVASVALDLAPIGDHQPAHPAPETPVIVITITPEQHTHLNTRRALIIANDLTLLHPETHRVLFRAAPTAQQLARTHHTLPLVRIRPEVTPIVRPD